MSERVLQAEIRDRQPPGHPPWSWVHRHGLWLVWLAPVGANLVASVFNIWYNRRQIEPFLSPAQLQRFMVVVLVYNLSIYPLAVGIWAWLLASLRVGFHKRLRGEPLSRDEELRLQRRVINLPWYISFLVVIAWFLCAPIFLLSLHALGEPIPGQVVFHLPVAFLVSGSLAVTHGFFAVESLSQRLLCPVVCQEIRPASVPGAIRLSLRGRGLVWAISAVVCPVVSLLLLIVVPDRIQRDAGFSIAVGLAAICFGIALAWLLGEWFAQPIRLMMSAARRVALGQYDVDIDAHRADDLGQLIDEFNRMMRGLREREKLRETFGLHVGEQAAKEILSSNPGLQGREAEITVMFVDVRDFTRRSERVSPQQVVTLLNHFFENMVDIVQEHGGLVNKYLGDGFMALFGLGEGGDRHADQAVSAGLNMLEAIRHFDQGAEELENEPLAIGIGIHTGNAIVGCIGSVRRLEFTAIGDAVNVASRVESLTKVLGEPLLLTESTAQALTLARPLRSLPPQTVRGRVEPVHVYTVDRNGAKS